MSAKRNANATADRVVEDTGELAQLVDQVVEGHAPILVARAGEPKAALVSMEDYARLKQEGAATAEKLSMEEWSRQAQKLREEILAYRSGKPIDLDTLIGEMREDLEERDAHNRGH